MLALINRTHFLVSYRHLILNSCRPTTLNLSTSSSTSFYLSDEKLTPSAFDKFLVQQLSWKLSHQPHSANIRKKISSYPENELLSSSTQDWDWWFGEKSQIFSLTSASQIDSISSETVHQSDSSLLTSMSKRHWSSSSDYSSQPKKIYRWENHFRGPRILPQRTWSITKCQDRCHNSRHEHFSFQVVSYNVLAQELIEKNLNLYRKCARYDLEWSQRKHRLFQEILQQNADIICLQEVQDVHYHHEFQPRMAQNGYESIYIRRTGNKTDGCALFYRRNRLRLVRSKKVPFYQRNIEVLNRENCGLIALFQPKSSKSTSDDLFCVANTHLLFSPKRGDIKLAQIQYFLAEIDKMSLKENHLNSHYPIIFCGDFNAKPGSPLSQFLIDGHIKYDEYRRIEISGQIPVSSSSERFSLQLPSDHLLPPSFVTSECRFPGTGSSFNSAHSIFDTNNHGDPLATLTHNKRFRSAYDMNDSSKVTTRIDDDSGLVDYIFYTKSLNDRHRLNLVGLYELYDRDSALPIHLPNHQFPSDHFLLSAKFALKLHSQKKSN